MIPIRTGLMRVLIAKLKPDFDIDNCDDTTEIGNLIWLVDHECQYAEKVKNGLKTFKQLLEGI